MGDFYRTTWPEGCFADGTGLMCVEGGLELRSVGPTLFASRKKHKRHHFFIFFFPSESHFLPDRSGGGGLKVAYFQIFLNFECLFKIIFWVMACPQSA